MGGEQGQLRGQMQQFTRVSAWQCWFEDETHLAPEDQTRMAAFSGITSNGYVEWINPGDYAS